MVRESHAIIRRMQKGNKIALTKKSGSSNLRATDTPKKGTKWNGNNDQTVCQEVDGEQANEAGKEQGIRWLSVSQKTHE